MECCRLLPVIAGEWSKFGVRLGLLAAGGKLPSHWFHGGKFRASLGRRRKAAARWPSRTPLRHSTSSWRPWSGASRRVGQVQHSHQRWYHRFRFRNPLASPYAWQIRSLLELRTPTGPPDLGSRPRPTRADGSRTSRLPLSPILTTGGQTRAERAPGRARRDPRRWNMARGNGCGAGGESSCRQRGPAHDPVWRILSPAEPPERPEEAN